MPQHLRDAAERRHKEAVHRATVALGKLSEAGAAINFSSVAREARVSTDFLYRQPQLRQQIQQLRSASGTYRDSEQTAAQAGSSAPVRALSAQLKTLRRNCRQEIAALQAALAAAHGENLALRRKLAAYEQDNYGE